jgi:hypothetical protein
MLIGPNEPPVRILRKLNPNPDCLKGMKGVIEKKTARARAQQAKLIPPEKLSAVD